VIKQVRQVAGVDSVKVVDFKKGRFAITPKQGASISTNALLDAVRKGGFTPGKIVTPNTSSLKQTRPGSPESKTQVERLFAQARDAFRDADYSLAAQLASRASAGMPGVGKAKQFLALTHFAKAANGKTADKEKKKNYEAAASAAHRGLHLGPHWNWKTVSQHYANSRDYTPHLRALQKYTRENPSAAHVRFLLGYHYLIMGYSDAARVQLNQARKLEPKDQVIEKLLKQLEKGKDAPKQP